MLKKDSPIFLQNINMIARQLFLLFKKSTTFWDNPRNIHLFPFLILRAGFGFRLLQFMFIAFLLLFKNVLNHTAINARHYICK